MLYLLPYPFFKAVVPKVSSGQFLATSVHFTFLPPLKVRYSIPLNIPWKLKTHLQILAFHTQLCDCLCYKPLLMLVCKHAHLLLHILFFTSNVQWAPLCDPSIHSHSKTKDRQGAVSGLAPMLLRAWPTDHTYTAQRVALALLSVICDKSGDLRNSYYFGAFKLFEGMWELCCSPTE